jgi:ribose 5-phosphate isomerase B
MKIAVSSDEHRPLVDVILQHLRNGGHDAEYLGPAEGQEADWPDVSVRAARQVADGAAEQAIVMCWTGTGATIAANKVIGIRAALCSDAETARGARLWNAANVLGLSLRTTSEAVAREILDAWFATQPGDDEWNRRQIARLSEIERLSEMPIESRRPIRPR